MFKYVLVILGVYLLIKFVSLFWKSLGKVISVLFYSGILLLLLYKWIYSPQVVEILNSYAPDKTPAAAALQVCKDLITDVTPVIGKTIYDMAMHTEQDTLQVDTTRFIENNLPDLSTVAKPLNTNPITIR